ncbi:MAG: hypothetical protein RL535_1514 [Pseudomonadota bacterium]
MTVKIYTNGRIELDGQDTGLGVFQHLAGSHICRRENVFKGIAHSEIKMPRNRYTLSTDSGRAEFDSDIRSIVTRVRFKNSGSEGTNMGAFEVRGDGVYIDGALIDKEFMGSGDYWLQCDSVAQAVKVRELIMAASLV